MWAFLFWGVPLALLGVVPAYRFWAVNPKGNPRAPLRRTAQASSPPANDEAEVFTPWHNPKNLGLTLPGITKDWSFTDNWASSAGLVAALFTAVFASTDTIETIVPPMPRVASEWLRWPQHSRQHSSPAARLAHYL